MNENSQEIVPKLWNYHGVLRKQGLFQRCYFTPRAPLLRQAILKQAFGILLSQVLIVVSISAASQPINKDALIELSRRNAVEILVSGQRSGTGFFVDRFHVGTCFHVVADLSVPISTITWNISNKIEIVCNDPGTGSDPNGESVGAFVPKHCGTWQLGSIDTHINAPGICE